MRNARSALVRTLRENTLLSGAVGDLDLTGWLDGPVGQEQAAGVRSDLTPMEVDLACLWRALVGAALAAHVAHDAFGRVRLAQCPQPECVYRAGLLDRTSRWPDA